MDIMPGKDMPWLEFDELDTVRDMLDRILKVQFAPTPEGVWIARTDSTIPGPKNGGGHG